MNVLRRLRGLWLPIAVASGGVVAMAALIVPSDGPGSLMVHRSPSVVSHQTSEVSIVPDRDDPSRLMPAPTPVPTATPSAAPEVAKETQQTSGGGTVALRPPTPVPPPVQQGVRWAIEANGSRVGIGGSVGNCRAATRPVPYGAAYFDSCQPGTWFDCHIGTCPSWNGWGVGTVVHYFDGSGADHAVTISSVVRGTAGQPTSVYGSWHFQVCQLNVPNAPVVIFSA